MSKNRMGFLNYVNILAFFFVCIELDVVWWHRFFIPLINISFYLIVSILGQLFLENLDMDLLYHISATN